MGQATLSDGNKIFIFPLAPETITESISGDYAANSVLDTFAPNLRRKSASTTIKLSRCLLISHTLQEDQNPRIATLRYWSKNQTKLKFRYNLLALPICYIKNITVDVKQYRESKPVHVEIEIELIEGKAEFKEVTKIPAKKITPREQQKKAAAIKTKLRNPAKKVALGLVGDYGIEVSELAQVTITNDGEFQEYDFDELDARLT